MEGIAFSTDANPAAHPASVQQNPSTSGTRNTRNPTTVVVQRSSNTESRQRQRLPVEMLVDKLDEWRREDREWEQRALEELKETIEKTAKERNQVLLELVRVLNKDNRQSQE